MIQLNSTPDIEESHAYDILSNERRRETIRYLIEADGTVDVSDISSHVARQVCEDGATPSGDLEHSTYISLVQTHLPKLDEFDLVEYDDSAKRVTATENLADLEAYLSPCQRFQGVSSRGLRLLVPLCVVSILALVLLSLTGGVVRLTVLALGVGVNLAVIGLTVTGTEVDH